MIFAICDDDLFVLSELRKMIENWSERKGVSVSVSAYSTAESLLIDAEGGKSFDSYILDLEFPGKMGGYALAEIIRKTDRKVPIVFVTNSNDYLLRGYELEICRYIKKPLNESELEKALDRCLEKSSENDNEGITVRIDRTNAFLKCRDIVSIESGIHTVTYCLTDGRKLKEPLYGSFETFSGKLPGYFLRCHRGHIVNLYHVYSYTNSLITMDNRAEIPLGGLFKEQSIESLQKWFLNNVLL